MNNKRTIDIKDYVLKPSIVKLRLEKKGVEVTPCHTCGRDRLFPEDILEYIDYKKQLSEALLEKQLEINKLKKELEASKE